MTITGILFIALTLTPAQETLRLNLDQALTLALKNSPQAMDVGTARLQAVVTALQGASPLLPSPALTLTGTKQENNSAIWNTDLTLSQVLFDPTAFAALISGIVNSDYHHLDARDKTARLIYDVTTDYLNLLKAQLVLNAARKALEQAAASKELTTARFHLGEVSRIDLLRSEAFYSRSRLNLLNAEKALALAQEKLKSTAGISTGVAIQATEELSQPAQLTVTSPESLLALIEKENPSVQMNTRLNTVSRINLVSAIARIIPTFTVYRSWGFLDTTLPRNYHTWQERTTTTDGIRISVPIVNIKDFFITILDAITASRRARATLARTRLQIYALARSALLESEEASLRYQEAKVNFELNRTLYELARTQYELGAISLVELLEVEANLAQAEAGYFSALCDTYIQSAQIGYLLGRTRVREMKGR